MARLEGKLALVTGGARGLGAAIARRFHDEGAAVIINDLRQDAAEAAARTFGGAGFGADVADSAAVAAMFAEVDRRFGRLDILVNNAGISGLEGNEAAMGMLADVLEQQARERAAGQPVTAHLDATMHTPDEAWQAVIGVHLHGTFHCTREALKIMSRANRGAIINMGSIMGTTGGAGAVAYCAAKAGILGFTRAVAREVVTRNIRVNAIAPGFIDTDMTAPIAGTLRRQYELATPMGRFGDPDDIAWAAVYLASEEAKFVTGQVLSPNGGWAMNQ